MGAGWKTLKREGSRLFAWVLLFLALLLYPLLLGLVSLMALVHYLKGGDRIADRRAQKGRPGT